jgi:hypothetical protein
MFRLVACLTAVLLASTSVPAAAQSSPSCVKRPDLMRYLADRYHEIPVAVGLADNGGVLEVFAAIDGATWTVAITMPNGRTCMVATGENWENVPRVATLGPPA